MILLAAFVLGALVGWRRASVRGGDRLDHWQYAAVHGIALTLAAVALTVLAEAGLFSGAALLMGRFGETELAAHTLALNLAALAFQIPFGTAQAATIRVGFHHGAGDRLAAGRAGWVAIAIGTGFMCTTALAMMLMPTALLRVYVDPDAAANAALVAFAVQYLTLAAIFQLADGVQAVGAGALRGLQDTQVPMWIAGFSYWVVGIPVAWGLAFPGGLGPAGLWLGLCAGLAFASALLMARLMHVDFLTAYLATSPGGLDSMAIIAVDAHADVGLVLGQARDRRSLPRHDAARPLGDRGRDRRADRLPALRRGGDDHRRLPADRRGLHLLLRDCLDLRRRRAGAGFSGPGRRSVLSLSGILAGRIDAPGREKTRRTDPSGFPDRL